MSVLFAFALTSTGAVVVGLALAWRTLAKKAHGEAIDRSLFAEFDEALAQSTVRTSNDPHGE